MNNNFTSAKDINELHNSINTYVKPGDTESMWLVVIGSQHEDRNSFTVGIHGDNNVLMSMLIDALQQDQDFRELLRLAIEIADQDNNPLQQVTIN